MVGKVWVGAAAMVCRSAALVPEPPVPAVAMLDKACGAKPAPLAGEGHQLLMAAVITAQPVTTPSRSSCGARRMAQSAAHLVDYVIPRVPVRQWVLSFPIPLRILLAAHPDLLSPLLRCIHRVIATFLIKQSGLKRSQAHTGAVTLIQRFGSAANLNIHLHWQVADGAYRGTEGVPVFHQAWRWKMASPPPSSRWASSAVCFRMTRSVACRLGSSEDPPQDSREGLL